MLGGGCHFTGSGGFASCLIQCGSTVQTAVGGCADWGETPGAQSSLCGEGAVPLSPASALHFPGKPPACHVDTSYGFKSSRCGDPPSGCSQECRLAFLPMAACFSLPLAFFLSGGWEASPRRWPAESLPRWSMVPDLCGKELQTDVCVSCGCQL